jgi:GntR family transcriptional regulator, galactonate operon transcriptional repressor
MARGLHGQTVELLARRIISGSFAEGATLNLTALQAELDISLTALREALKVLAAKGMVDARPKRGTFVRPRTDWRLLDGDVLRWELAGGRPTRLLEDLHELRGIVEPAAAAIAATRATDADLAALEAALAAMAVADADPDAAVVADLNFHRALLAATHNELMLRMALLMETGLAERDRLVHRARADTDPVPTHRAVMAAIRRRQPDAAARAMRRLLQKSDEDVARL